MIKSISRKWRTFVPIKAHKARRREQEGWRRNRKLNYRAAKNELFIANYIFIAAALQIPPIPSILSCHRVTTILHQGMNCGSNWNSGVTRFSCCCRNVVLGIFYWAEAEQSWEIKFRTQMLTSSREGAAGIREWKGRGGFSETCVQE